MQIREGIDEEFRSQAAEIFWQAFRDKLKYALGPAPKAHAYFAASFQSEHAITAVDGDRLVGIAGYDVGEGSLVSDRFSAMFLVYGLSSFWRAPLLLPFARDFNKGGLQLDGIAVAEDARGQGVGTALMQAIFEKARQKNCDNVYLHVIDTNTRARALYEKLGFVEVKSVGYGLFSPLTNIRAATKMVKPIR